MTFEWETRKERVKRFMKIPALKKMEWLRQMNAFMIKTSSRKMMTIRLKLRENR